MPVSSSAALFQMIIRPSADTITTPSTMPARTSSVKSLTLGLKEGMVYR
jgi:hypothetical protein